MELQSPERTHEIAADIATHLKRTDLKPSPEVNSLFSKLVDLSLRSDGLVNKQLQVELRQLAATGEAYMEHYWAREIIDDSSRLQEFPYLQNYLELSTHEYDELSPYAGNTRKWAFVGSGPLPLSAIMFERLHESGSFTYIDNDPIANQFGEQVAMSLNGTAINREFITAHADLLRYDSYDVIIIAALVGRDESEKQTVLNSIAQTCRPSAIVAARSVPDDNRTLLYPRLETIPASYQLLHETCPPAGVINNLMILQKRD